MEKTMRVRLTFTEDALGTMPADPEIHKTYVASNAPDAKTMEEEIEENGVDEVFEKGTTIFPKLEDGTPYYYNYQIEGFFKDACGMLRRVPDTKSSKMKSYKKCIDGLIFVNERKVPIKIASNGDMCQRPLRADTAQGERVALASSESVPAGSTLEFSITCLVDKDMDTVIEWLDYGIRRGLGQWRNSGKGRFVWEKLDDDGNVVAGGNKRNETD